MTYPNAPLGVRIRAAAGLFNRAADPATWPWVDLTLDVDHLVPIEDNIGGPDDDSEPSTTLSFALKNDTSRITTTVFARYTTDNPESDLYPYFDVGCPIEWAIDVGDGGGYDVQCITFLQTATNAWPSNTQYKSVAQIQCIGLLQLGGVPTQQQRSPMYRTVMDRRNAGFWPMEDPSGSTTAASAIPSQAALPRWNFAEPFEFGAEALVPGVSGGARISTGQAMQVRLNRPLTGTGLRLGFLFYCETAPVGTGELVSFSLADLGRYAIELSPSGLRFRAYNTASAELSGAAIAAFTGHLSGPVFCEVDVIQNGSNVDWSVRETVWSINTLGQASPSLGFVSGSYAGTVGTIVTVGAAIFGNIDGVWMSSLAATEPPFPAAGGFAAVLGWAGNTAAGRVAGMADEAGLPSSVVSTTLGAVLGPQLIDTVRANMLDVQHTDHGVLTDHLGKLSYRTLQELYNALPVFTLTRQVRGQLGELTPVRDDTARVNRITVTRSSGGSATVEDTADIAAHGTFETSPTDTLNVALESALVPHAGWYLARGTSPGYRYSELVLHMRVAAEYTPALAGQASALQLGDMITITTLPPQAAKMSIDRQVRGRKQTILNRGMKEWTITYAMVPVEAYRVLVLDADQLDTSGTEVILAASTTDTVIMTATAGALVTPSGGKSISLDMAGEQVTLATVASEVITDTYTRTVSNGWGSVPATAHLPAYAYSPSVLASDYAVAAGVGTMLLSAAFTARTMWLLGLNMINPDFTVYATVPVLATGGNIELQVGYRFLLSGADNYAFRIAIAPGGATRLLAYIPGTTDTVVDIPLGLTHTAGATYGIRVAPIGSTHRCKVWLGSTSANEPTGWAATFEDSTRLTPGPPLVRSARGSGNTNAALTISWDNLTFNNVQAWTVTRSQGGGVVKAQAVGNQIKLWRGKGLGI